MSVILTQCVCPRACVWSFEMRKEFLFFPHEPDLRTFIMKAPLQIGARFLRTNTQHFLSFWFFLCATFQYLKANIKFSLCCVFVVVRSSEAPHPFSIQPASAFTIPLLQSGERAGIQEIKPICLFIVFIVLAVCGDSTIAQWAFSEPVSTPRPDQIR